MNSVIRKILIAVAAAAAINTVAVLVGRGSFGHLLVVGVSIGCVAAPLFLISVGIMLWSGMKRPRWLQLGMTLNLVGVVAGSLIISGLIGVVLAKMDVREAKRYCESLVPQIEAYKAEQGEYPETIDSVESLRKKPRLLVEGPFYRQDAESYDFHVREPQGVTTYWIYSGEGKTWYKD